MSKSQKKSTAKSSHESKQNVKEEQDLAKNEDQEESLDKLFAAVKEQWGELDFIIHSIAFTDKNELRGRYVDTSLNNFLNSMHISCYSFVSIATLRCLRYG